MSATAAISAAMPKARNLPDLEAARREAVNAIREMMGERLLHGGAIDGRADRDRRRERRVCWRWCNSGEVICPGRSVPLLRDDVTKSAPVANPISAKPAAK